ncbi:MAG: methyltransferase domain-containing protein [Pseudomonadota bacterium]
MELSQDRQDFLRQIRKAKAVDKVDAIVALAEGKAVLDAGFLNHTLEGYGKSPLHEELAKVSKKLIGIDLNYKESTNLPNCFRGDLTYPLWYGSKKSVERESFDLIIAADLIEHLDSIRFFLCNCIYLLKVKGKLILTTPTPFYMDNFVYAWLMSDELVNPDHVCWIDPFNMRELLRRYGFEIKELYWIKSRWNLAAFVAQRKGRWYNHRTSDWEGEKARIEKALLPFTMAFWMGLRKVLTLFSPLNRWAGYMVVCERR